MDGWWRGLLHIETIVQIWSQSVVRVLEGEWGKCSGTLFNHGVVKG